jgi:subtilase family serine protease
MWYMFPFMICLVTLFPKMCMLMPSALATNGPQPLFHTLRAAIWCVSCASLGLLAGCGDDGDGASTSSNIPVELTFTSPSGSDILVAGSAITFAVSFEATGDEDLPESIRYDWNLGDGTTLSGSQDSLEHTFADDGNYLVTVRASALDGEDVVAEATAAISVDLIAPADLSVSVPVLTVPTDTLSTADPFRVTFDMTNSAGAIPQAFNAGVFLAPEESVPPGSTIDSATFASLRASGSLVEIALREFEGLAADGRANVDLSGLLVPEGTPSGRYSVVAWADPEGVVSETDLANNGGVAARSFQFFDTTGEGPDLLARDVSVRPGRANVLARVTLDAAIANVGTSPALLFPYSIYLSKDRLIDDADTLIGGGNVENASPNTPVILNDVVVDLPTPVTELGEYYVLIQPDPDNTITETNETNNVGVSNRIVVTDEPIPGIDIVATAFDVLPRTTFIDGSVEIRATIANTGSDPISAQFFCRVHLSVDETLEDTPGGDRVLTTLLVDPIPGDGSVDIVQVARVQSFFTAGDYYAFLACDPAQVVAEADEDNNVSVAEGVVTIAGDAVVNLRPGAFTINPATIDNEGLVDVSLDVCNDGSAGSTPSVVRVHLSADPLYDSSDTVLLQSRVPPIDPGACLTIRADVPAVCDTFQSSYTAFVVVDATSTVPETDEDDNSATLDSLVTINGLICDCEDDRFEPNDSLVRAALISATSRVYEDLTTCTAAIDWYRVPLLRGESIRVAILFDSDRGNLDMSLYGTDRASLLSTSTTNGDREEVAYFVAPSAGDYYLQVFGRTADDRNVYDMDLAVSARASGIDILPVTARVTPTNPVLGQTVSLSFDIVNLGDTPAGEFQARFFLSEDAIINPAEDIRLDELVISGLTDRLSRTVDVTLPSDIDGGQYYIGVVADSRADITELDETNNTTVTPPLTIDGDCFDVLEPNNSTETARDLDLSSGPPVTLAGLLACTDNRDFYSVCVADGSFLTLTATFDTAAGDIDLRLFDELGVQVDRSESTGGTETVGVDYSAGERCYTLEVYVAGLDREVPYTLQVDTGAASDDLACSLIEEPNNGFAAALPLRDFYDADVAICPLEDEDYYSVTLTARSEISVRLLPAEGETTVPEQLRLTVFNPSRGFLTSAVSATEILRPAINTTGTYLLRVRSNGSAPRSQAYRIEITGVPGVDLVPSNLLLEPASGLPGDSIRFTWNLANTRDAASAATTYGIYLSDDTVWDDSDTLLRQLDLPAVAGFETRIEGRRFDIPSDLVTGGLFNILVVVDDTNRIVEFSDRNNVTSAELVVSPRCAPDLAEPNNFSFEAFSAADAEGESLTLCADVDWYTFTAPRAGTFTASIRFTHAAGDLDLYAYRNPAAAPFAVSDSIDDDESVTFTASNGETIWLYVEAFQNDVNSYTLAVD